MVKRKRLPETSHRVNSTIKKVFLKYGRDVSEEQISTDPQTVGRKQRRRNAKIMKKQSKMKHFQLQSKNESLGEKKQPANAAGEEKSHQVLKKKRMPKKETGEEIRKKVLENDNKKEDKAISALEKKLYLSKRKGKKLPKSFRDAGLDYILDVVGGNGGLDLEIDNDSDEDFFSSLERREKDHKEEDENDPDLNGEEEKNSSGLDDDDEENFLSGDEDMDGVEQSLEDEKEEAGEDLPGKYIPPALRVRFSSEQKENMKKMRRRLKGLLNRLSNANISGICNDIEACYRESSRAIMHGVVTEAILEQFCTPDPAPESQVTENSMLIAALSQRVGVESLMHFYEVVSLKLNVLISSKDDSDGKASNNLLQLLGSLYQLKSIDCKVLLDIFRLLVESFTEKDVELMLEILNRIGFQLRKDDPASLMEIVKAIVSKCEDLKISTDDGSRMSFMLNILMAIKNNNVRKVTGFDPKELSLKRKKLATLSRNSQGDGDSGKVPPVTLQDFLDIETNGRWWIVGSSFAGRPMLRNQTTQGGEEDVDDDALVSTKVVEAARRQRMNTDVRRKIFYAIMTSDDFVDAFEKVMKCGLKGKQLREIATVIVDCCQQEKSYNPYYLHLLNKFCQHDRQFSISIQCTLWDRFKILDSMKDNQLENIAQLLCQLIVAEALSLNCLKAIEFTEIDAATIRFLRLFLCTLAEACRDFDHLKAVFHKLQSPKTKSVRQGLNLFVQYFALRDEKFMSEHSTLSDHFQIMSSTLGTSSTMLL